MKVLAIAALFAAGVGAGLWAAGRTRQAAPLPAARVTGIDGVFMKARDPKVRGAWYGQALGIDVKDGTTCAILSWREHGDASRTASTVWSLFTADSRYFAPSDAPFMVNYRVRNPDTLLAQLRALGVTLVGGVVEEFNGRFAWSEGSEGHKIELGELKPGF